MIKTLFTKHPNQIGETYLEHMWYASCCGLRLVVVGILCIVHAFFPFLFCTTASDTIINMYNSLKLRNPKCKD